MRTLYDPECHELYPGAFRMLQLLARTHDLYLVTRKEGQREHAIKDHGITDFFQDISFVDRKTQKHFAEIIEKSKREYEEIFVVGDVIWDEIMIGNKLGWKTIWFQNGKFKDALPKEEVEMPWKTAGSIAEILELFEE